MGIDLLEDKDFACIFSRLVAKKMQEKKRKSCVCCNFMGNHTCSSPKNMRNTLVLLKKIMKIKKENNLITIFISLLVYKNFLDFTWYLWWSVPNNLGLLGLNPQFTCTLGCTYTTMRDPKSDWRCH